MRLTRLMLLAFALMALLGSSRPAAAGNTLNVSLGCFNIGAGNAGCNMTVTGGTGVYVSYAWQFKEQHQPWLSYLDRSYFWTTTEPWLQDSCTVPSLVTFTVTVTDSLGETGTDTQTIACSEWAD